MSLLPNYIYKYILKCIINYIYYCCNTLYLYSNEQVLQLSIVNKVWFKYVGEIVSNQNTIFSAMNKLIEEQPSTHHQSFKLIKYEQSIKKIQCYLDTNYYQLIEKLNNETCKLIKINCGNITESNEIIKVIEKLPSNCSVNMVVSAESYIRAMESRAIKCTKDQLSKINNINVNHFTSPLKDIYNLLLHYTPKSISFGFLRGYGAIAENLFTMIFNSREGQSINIDHLVFPTNEFKESLDSLDKPITSTLKSISYTTSITRLLNCVPLLSSSSSSNEYNNNILKWNYIVNQLSNDETLVSIDFIGMNLLYKQKHGVLDSSVIYNGFKSILLNQKSLNKLSIYGLSDNMKLPIEFTQGLAGNKSIKTLKIYGGGDLESIIQDIIYHNRVIRNLYIQLENSNIHWLELLKDHSRIDLYSISIYIYSNNILDSYVDYIKSNTFNIKEINILNRHSLNNKYSTILNNNTIINIYKE